MKKIVILLIALMVISIGMLSGCNESTGDILSSEEKRFVGTWKTTDPVGNNIAITFFSDRTCAGFVYPNYEVKDEKIVFSMYVEGNKIQLIFDYSFSDNDIILTLTSVDTGKSDIYTKQ